MKNPTDVGMNRSGLATAPLMAPEMLEVPTLTHPSLEGDEGLIDLERIDYSREGEPSVTMPPPGTLKELAKTVVKLIKGEKATVLIDRLGERLAFERSGVRLYEALLSKYDAFGSFDGGPTRLQLETIHMQEFEHFRVLTEAIAGLGSDPTAVTPSANVQDVLSTGLRMVITDPRMNLQQCLEAVLVAELADNDSWTSLIRLTRLADNDELADQFEICLQHEVEHLSSVRSWLAAGLEEDATGEP